MNPYEAPQTVDQPPKKPWRWPWRRAAAPSKRHEEASGWPSLGIVAVIVAMNALRSCNTPSSTPNRIPSSTFSNSPPQQLEYSPEVQKLLEELRAKRNQTSPQPSPMSFEP